MTEKIEIRVKPTKLLFFNEDSFFGIYSCDVNPDDISMVKINKWNNISIKGVTPKLNLKEEYTVTLLPDEKSQYEGSYIIDSLKKERPQTIADQKVFLSAILTPTQIENIYEVYNEEDDIVGLIERREFDYAKIKGLGEKTFEKLQQKVLNNIDSSELLAFCKKHDIKYNLVAKLVKEYKNPNIVIDKINQNPYVLTEIKGIGFKKADEIAKATGYSMTSPHRIDSAIRYIISEENMSGHSWISFKPLLSRAVELLNISKEHIENRLYGDIDGVVNAGDERYTRESILKAEKFIAETMTQIKTQSKTLFEKDELDKFLDEYCEKNGLELEENQRQFFHDWNENSILFLVGGGGMGKSYLQKILLDLVQLKSLSVALLAPTGKASKVMAGYTKRPASTIHRRVGVYDEDTDGNNALEEDVIIVDESSMCDVFILAKLFKAITNTNVRILFVGDDFQLPSVGVGNFLYDSINSGCIKVSKLKKVFRQAEGGILDIATKTRNGESYLNSESDGRILFGKDCVFWLSDQKYVRDGVITNYKKVIKQFNQDDVTILTPTNKGKLGTIELNKEIQKIANPPSTKKKEKAVGHKDFPTIFRVGDSVMNIVNTYGAETVQGGKADIFNGDTGKLIDIDETDSKDKHAVVDFDGIHIKIPLGNILTQLVHSWVTTIHKSQGSQFQVVIVIVDKSAKFQLNANLIYTGFSRAKKYMLVLGQADAINHGIKKFANMERRSFLQEMLQLYNGHANEPILDYKEEIGHDEDNQDKAVGYF